MDTSISYEFLTREQASEYLKAKGCHITSKTLATWASTKRYQIPIYHIGRWVRYRKKDLDDWIESRRTAQTIPAI